MDAADRVVEWLVEKFCPKDQHADQWNIERPAHGILGTVRNRPEEARASARSQTPRRAHRRSSRTWSTSTTMSASRCGAPERMRMHERMIMLQVVDGQWKDHLLAMDHLKEGIGLRGYSQRDPLVEYKRESFEMFEAMMDRVEDETLRYLFLMRTPEEEEEMIRQYQQRKRREQREMQMVGGGRGGETAAGHPARKDWAQRSLPLRERQEIQEVPWGGRAAAEIRDERRQ